MAEDAVVNTEAHVVDVELTNRCNTHCDFCPRERTPHQGLMADATFERALARVVEFRGHVRELYGAPVRMSFCGLGETLLHRGVGRFLRAARGAGFAPSLCSNGALLTERVSAELIDAGLGSVYVNCGEIGEDYDLVYHLEFQRIVDNIRRFLELAGDDCELHIVLVDHRQDRARIDEVEAFWRDHGVTNFFYSPMLNRAGTIDVEGMAFEGSDHQRQAIARFAARGELPVCPAAFAYPFIGYDGNYYLCSSDWEKRVPCGNLVDHSLLDTFRRRAEAVTTRDPICRHCNHDPINQLAWALRREARGEIDAAEARLAEAILAQDSDRAKELLGVVAAAGWLDERPDPAPRRRLIPVAVS